MVLTWGSLSIRTRLERRRHSRRRGEVCRLDLTDPDLPKAADVIDELADALGGVW